VETGLSGFHLEHAMFDQFVWRDAAGRVRFEGRIPATGKRHRDRVWPALSRYKRYRRKKRWSAHRHARMNRAIDASSLLTVLRRWMPLNPLEARHMAVCDHAQRPPRYDPW
jgi:hypothetical protein